MQDENDVIEAVCLYLAQQGFVINERRHTTQRGIDIKATHLHSGKTLYIEVKGGTSSRCGSLRYGKPYTKSQVFDRTAKGVYTLLQMHGKLASASFDFALAVPDTEWFMEYLDPIKNTLQTLGLQVLLVDEDKKCSQFVIGDINMTLTLAPETETRLRTIAEGYGIEPAALHEDWLQQALAEAEAELNETLAGLDASVEAMAEGRWMTVDE